MASANSLFHKTAAGRAACALAGSALPAPYRALLRAVGHATSFAEIALALPHCGESRLLDQLEDLEAIGLVESVSAQWLLALYSAADYDPRPLAE